MPKDDQAPAPEVVSRENAKDSRIVEGTEAFRRLLERCPPEALKLDEEQAALRVPDPVFPIDIGERLMAGVASHDIRREPDTQEQELVIGLASAEPDSSAPGIATLEQINPRQPPATSNAAHTTAMGNVPAMPPVESPASVEALARARANAVTNRLLREGRWKGQAEATRNDLMAACKRQGMAKEQAQEWTYSELDRMYPPPEVKPPSLTDSDIISELAHLSPLVPTKPISETGDSGAIQGLAEIPPGWPTLPANASLGAELGWVQANRLRIVEERPGRATSVKLGQALSPAPSWAALGWLETSIRSYAKFVDVAAKAASGGDDDEGAVMKRERKSVDEVRALLDEMKAAEGTCPACGRPH